MADIYVSGPVIRDVPFGPVPPVPSWVERTYEMVFDSAQDLGADIAYPRSEVELEAATSRGFFETINERISKSKVAVVVFTGGDVSSGVEATVAAALNKPILLVTDYPDRVPRLLRGLPTVSRLIRPEEAWQGGLRSFLYQNLRGHAQ